MSFKNTSVHISPPLCSNEQGIWEVMEGEISGCEGPRERIWRHAIICLLNPSPGEIY